MGASCTADPAAAMSSASRSQSKMTHPGAGKCTTVPCTMQRVPLSRHWPPPADGTQGHDRRPQESSQLHCHPWNLSINKDASLVLCLQATPLLKISGNRSGLMIKTSHIPLNAKVFHAQKIICTL